jgi:hypothetical protein
VATAAEAFEFERRVAAIYRMLGADVQHDIALAGNQIDVLLNEQTEAGTAIRSAVECKYHARAVGVDIVNAFAALVTLLKSRNLIERGIIVAKSGFTRNARAAAEQFGIDLIEAADLEQRVAGRETEIKATSSELDLQQTVSVERLPIRAFVVMPFAAEFNDIYMLGIREVAEELGLVAERADEIHHNDSIPDVIRHRINRADVVIAETSTHNPNVYYEVGLAHGVGKPTILLCKDAGAIPFDLAAINHIVYSSITDLRELLAQRLRSTLPQKDG